MRILVTGGTGQIGGGVVRALLRRGEDVRCLIRDPERLGNLEGLPDVELAEGDVTDPASLSVAMQDIDAVIHAAGVVSYEDRLSAQMRQVNVIGTQNMLNAAAAAGVHRFVLTGSIAGLGWLPGQEIGDEETVWNWAAQGIDYLQTKHDAQRLVLSDTRMETVVVMPGIVLGEGDLSGNGVRLLLQLWRGRVPVAPPGATTATTLRDAISGHLLALEHGTPGHAYVISSWNGPFQELYSRIGNELDCPAPRIVLPAWALRVFSFQRYWMDRLLGRPTSLPPALARIIVRNRRYSSQKAIHELGYVPTPIEDGIRACWRWAQETGQVQ